VGENLAMPPEGKKGDRKTGHGSQVRKKRFYGYGRIYP
jgi:hypothetical protein